MALRIVHEDLVDWEPLSMRFVPSRRLAVARATRMARYIQQWMDEAAEASPDLWRMAKEWQTSVSDEIQVVAQCELMPHEELGRLADELEGEFPELCEIRLGCPLDGPASLIQIDWFTVEGTSVQIGKTLHDVTTFDISFLPITLGQFEEFLRATDYLPVPDRLLEMPGYVVDHSKLNFGPSPKHPLFGVTHDDATAFCEWAGLRLPTDAELKLFFHATCRQGKQHTYSGECWTSTSTSKGKYVAWNGPYQESELGAPDRKYRKLLDRHQYEFLEAPCFRVVRSPAER